MGCKVKNKGRRTIITKNGGNFMEKYIFDEGTCYLKIIIKILN